MNKKLLSLLALTSSIALANGFHGNYETENVAELGAYIAPNKGNDTKGLEDNSPSLTTKHHARLLFHDADLLVFGGGSFTAKKDEPIANKAFYGVHHYVGGRVDTKVGKGFSVALTGAYKSNKDEENWFKNAIKKQTDIKGTEPKMEYGYESEKGYTTLFSAVTYGEFEGAKLNFGTIHRTNNFANVSEEEKTNKDTKYFDLKSFAKVSKNFGLGSVESSLIHEIYGSNKAEKMKEKDGDEEKEVVKYDSNLEHFGKLNGEIKVKTDKLLDKTVFENVGKFEMKTIKATNDKGDREFSYGLDNKVTYTGIDKTTLGAFVNYNADVKFENLKQDENKSTFANKLHVGYEAKYDSNLELYTKTQNLTVFNNKIDDNFSNEGRNNYFDTDNMAKYKFSKGELRGVAHFNNKTMLYADEKKETTNKFFFVGGLGESIKTSMFTHSLDARVGFLVDQKHNKPSTDSNVPKVDENKIDDATRKPEDFLLTAWTENKVEKEVKKGLKLTGELNAYATSNAKELFAKTPKYSAELEKEINAAVPEKHMINGVYGILLTEAKAGAEYKTGKHELSQTFTGRHNLVAGYAFRVKGENDSKVIERDNGFINQAQVKSDTEYKYAVADNAKLKTGLKVDYGYNDLVDAGVEGIISYVKNTGVVKKDKIDESTLYYDTEGYFAAIEKEVKPLEDKTDIEYSTDLAEKEKVAGYEPKVVDVSIHSLKLDYDLGFDLSYLDNKLTISPSVEFSAVFAGKVEKVEKNKPEMKDGKIKMNENGNTIVFLMNTDKSTKVRETVTHSYFANPKFNAKAKLNLSYTW